MLLLSFFCLVKIKKSYDLYRKVGIYINDVLMAFCSDNAQTIYLAQFCHQGLPCTCH